MPIVIKRNGNKVDFDKTKISIAILKAMKNGSGIVKPQIAENIANEIQEETKEVKEISIPEIESLVFDKLITKKQRLTARAYEGYRSIREFQRNNENTIDEDIIKLINDENEYWKEENTNKNPSLNTVKRDYMAGIVSTDATRRYLLPPEIIQAHDEGIIHFHDADYYIQKEINCDVINLDDMLQNGTVISETMIEKPHSFATACTVTTQIIAQVSSSQYGGQSISLAHLVPFVDISRQKIRKEVIDELYNIADCFPDESIINNITEKRLLREIKAGIQTIQYQLITIMTTNGQAPFLTIFMYLNEVPEGRERNDMALLIEEILQQRIQGVKNEVGEWIAPAFPKLIYVLQENNITEGTEYWYLTKLAAECSSKRLVPDYISEKIMLELKGDVYTCMGCVQGDELVTYKYNNQLFVESFKRMWNRMSNYYEIKEQIPGNKDYLYLDIEDSMIDIYDTDKGFTKVHRVIRNKSDEWVNVKIQHGRTLICTPDHPFHTQRGRIRADELTQDDIVTINPDQYFEENQVYNSDKAWLLGFILCDGCYDNHVYCSIAHDSEDDIQYTYIKRMKECFDSDVDAITRERGKKGNYKDLISRGTVANIIDYLSVEFEGLTKARRHIPNEVFSWDYVAKLNFLAGMIDADGYINTTTYGGSVVQIGSTNKELALQQAALARALGMPASIYQNHYSKVNTNALRYRVEFAPSKDLLSYIISEKKKDNFVEHIIHDVFVSARINSVEKIEDMSEYSYDVTTESDHFEVSAIYSHNCRSFLTPDRFTEAGFGNIAKAKNYVPNRHKYYGRLTNRVSLNGVNARKSGVHTA